MSFTARKAEVEEKLDAEVMAAVSEQQAVVASKEAVKLRDAGKRKEAERLLKKNAAKLKYEARVYQSPKLLQQSREMEGDSRKIAKDNDWGRNRKDLRSKQYGIERQQSYK